MIRRSLLDVTSLIVTSPARFLSYYLFVKEPLRDTNVSRRDMPPNELIASSPEGIHRQWLYSCLKRSAQHNSTVSWLYKKGYRLLKVHR